MKQLFVIKHEILADDFQIDTRFIFFTANRKKHFKHLSARWSLMQHAEIRNTDI